MAVDTLTYHGHPRFTKDLDVFVEPTVDNAQRILKSLAAQIVQLGVAPNRIDLMTAIDGVTLQEAWAGRAQGRFGSEPVSYLGRAEFLRNKHAAGRPQDLADIDAIE